MKRTFSQLRTEKNAEPSMNGTFEHSPGLPRDLFVFCRQIFKTLGIATRCSGDAVGTDLNSRDVVGFYGNEAGFRRGFLYADGQMIEICLKLRVRLALAGGSRLFSFSKIHSFKETR